MGNKWDEHFDGEAAARRGTLGHGARRRSRQNPADALIWGDGPESLERTRQWELSGQSLQEKRELHREPQRTAGSPRRVFSRWLTSEHIWLTHCMHMTHGWGYTPPKGLGRTLLSAHRGPQILPVPISWKGKNPTNHKTLQSVEEGAALVRRKSFTVAWALLRVCGPNVLSKTWRDQSPSK